MKRVFVPQPAEFYMAAYRRDELLAAERPAGTAGCVAVQIRRPWHLRAENVWINPHALPPYGDRFLERYPR